MKALLTAAEVDAHMDTLDRGEPSAPPNLWQPAADALGAALDQVYNIQRVLVAPIVAISLGALFGWREYVQAESWQRGDLAPFIVVFLVLKFGSDAILRNIYPALEQDDRITALLRYYRVRNPRMVDPFPKKLDVQR